MPSVADLHAALEAATGAHTERAGAIDAHGAQVDAQLERSRAEADTAPTEDEIEAYAAEQRAAQAPEQ